MAKLLIGLNYKEFQVLILKLIKGPMDAQSRQLEDF